MKKIVLLLVVVLVALTTTTAQTHKLELTPMFKIGIFQDNTLGVTDLKGDIIHQPYSAKQLIHKPTQNIDYYVCVGGRLQYKNAGIESVNKIYCVTDNFLKNSPYLAKFYIRAFYQVNTKIKIQVEHLCIHPILSENKWETFRLRGGHTEISISYGFK